MVFVTTLAQVSEEEGRDLSRHHANLSDLVNIAELSVRRVIAMAKQVPAFRALPQVCLSVGLLKLNKVKLGYTTVRSKA